MKKLYKGKTYNIPDNYIKTAVRQLDITQGEAVKMWFEDNGIIINEEQEALTQKAVSSGVQKEMTRCKSAKKADRKREHKPDVTKEELINKLYSFLQSQKGVENVEIIQANKLIGFNLNQEHFTLNLIRNRNKK